MIVKRIKIFGLEEINMPIKFYKELETVINDMPIKFYKELETVINEWWDSLPEETKKDIKKVYEKYEKKENENE
jgi:TRAP-type C4-dicarboxylate transport system substrate-binding protein